MRAPLDVVALVFGVLLSAAAAAGLWLSFIGPLDWSVMKIVAPLGLVVVGIVGLALSRHRP